MIRITTPAYKTVSMTDISKTGRGNRFPRSSFSLRLRPIWGTIKAAVVGLPSTGRETMSERRLGSCYISYSGTT
jgi:hypothetical protein